MLSEDINAAMNYLVMTMRPVIRKHCLHLRGVGGWVGWAGSGVEHSACGKKTLKINMTNWQIICSIRMSSDTVTRAQARGTRG